MTDKIIVLSTCGADEAPRIAAALVESGTAACVNIVENACSVYRWQGKLCGDREALLIIKSRRDLFDALAAELRKVHSYDVPEMIALPVVAGSDPYLAWLDQSLRPAGS